MSSQDWENLGLPPMGEFCDNVSMYGANLEGHQQAEKLKRAQGLDSGGTTRQQPCSGQVTAANYSPRLQLQVVAAG